MKRVLGEGDEKTDISKVKTAEVRKKGNVMSLKKKKQRRLCRRWNRNHEGK